MPDRIGDAELETDAEEQRFFSQPPPAYEDDAALAPSSLSPTNRSVPTLPSSREARVEAARFGARRAKLQRRVVATLCAAVALLMLGVVVHGRAEAARRLADAAAPVRIHPEPRIVKEPVAAAQPASAVTPVVAPSAAAPSVAAPSVAAPSVAAPSVAAPSVAAPSVVPPPESLAKVESVAPSADAAKVLRKARNLLNSGRSREGVAAAREALALSPQEAEPYMLLGAGLQDLGKYSEARSVFDDCVKTATHGPVASCRYFARH